MKTFVDDDEEENSLIPIDGKLEMENLEKNLLVNLIRQSQNDLEMNSNSKPKSFDDLTKLNQRINHLNQQVRFTLQTNKRNDQCFFFF